MIVGAFAWKQKLLSNLDISYVVYGIFPHIHNKSFVDVILYPNIIKTVLGQQTMHIHM